MKQEQAVHQITQSLIADKRVRAVYLKGSIGRGEHDEHSDVDLYCLVDEVTEEAFLKDRLRHLEAYRKLVFYEDYFIIAPQIIAVFDDLLHVDLYTVTEKTFQSKDYFRVLYDPENILATYESAQTLALTADEFTDCAHDVAWFLFQYSKSANRSNDLWSAAMVHNVLINLAKVLLHRYQPDRAQLGLKELAASLPKQPLLEVKRIYNEATPSSHPIAVKRLVLLLQEEQEWLEDQLGADSQIVSFMKTMTNELIIS
ncbi:nucleotidyltransferase domain-containing protein [Bacillus sp. JCM 19041]|uniref:nucleotidyltransferase domain-containing protein n=1 Tax=Bacillus sp. JCM 19041 TaxID=1460637 RepID=UPI0006D04CBD